MAMPVPIQAIDVIDIDGSCEFVNSSNSQLG